MATKKSRYKRRRITLVLAFPFFLILAVSLVGWGISADWKAFKPITIAQFGTVETKVNGVGLALRNERVQIAPLGGQVEQYISEGTRVPAGKVVVKVTDRGSQTELSQELESLERRMGDIAVRNPFNQDPTDQSALATAEARQVEERLKQIREELAETQKDIDTPIAGTVSYYTDGLEEPEPRAAVENLLKMDYPLADFPREPRAASPTLPSREVEQGKPVFKVVDNLQFWIVADLPPQTEVSKGKRVSLRLSAKPDELLEARVEQVVAKEDYTRVVLFFPDFKPFFTTLRWLDLEVILSQIQGIVLPLNAIVNEGGKQGVYLEAAGGPIFKPVEIIGADEERVVVQGLAEGVKVIL